MYFLLRYDPLFLCNQNSAVFYRGVILFVVEDITQNICDQRSHEFEIRRQNPEVKVIRRNLTQLAVRAKLTVDKKLMIDDYVVSVVYYRSGYEPNQYHSQREWDARLLIEKSLAIKCPSIQYHLAGTKKVQQTLAKPGMVARFLKDEKTAAKVKEIFTGALSRYCASNIIIIINYNILLVNLIIYLQ